MPATLAPPRLRERLFGLETEYTFAATSRTGERMAGHEALPLLFNEVRRQQAHLPDRRSAGMFLGNSSRLYPDCGHPELATPEVRTPGDLVRYVLAGDRILSAAARTVCAQSKTIREIFLARSNVSYGRWPATWGCHESYGHSAMHAVVAPGIIPHLASRIIFTGAGGFNNHSAGLEFMLSPRVEYLKQSASDRSTTDRGIFHSKIEPLNGRGYHRLHIICGEGLCSQRGMWLKAATTALILALIDAGLRPGRGMKLKNPIAAMRAFAADPSCRATAPREFDDGPLSALAIQRHYLEQVEGRLGEEILPEWAPEACAEWRTALDLVEKGPAAAARTFDWAIKLALFQRHCRKSGFDWDALPRWNRVANAVRKAAAGEAARTAADVPEITAEMLRPSHPHHAAIQGAAPLLRDEGLSWDDFPAFLKLRDDLWALDARYSQLETGVFATLDRAGVLDHHAPNVERIDEATIAPPAFGRAALRGAVVRRLSAEGKKGSCDWDAVWDYASRRILPLDNPFAQSENWTDMPAEPDIESARSVGAQIARNSLDQLLGVYDEGRYEDGVQLLEMAVPYIAELGPSGQAEWNRYQGWFQSRRGFLSGNDALQAAHGNEPASLSAVADIICARRYQGLRPPTSIDAWFDRADRLIEANLTRDEPSQTTINSHRAFHLLRRGKPQAAHRCFELVLESPGFATAHPHVRSRIFADLGDACRAMGLAARADRYLEEAEEIHQTRGYEGDFADHTLTYRAKLADNEDAALAYLAQALDIQARLGNRMGEARTRLLQARLTSDPRLTLECKRRVHALRRQLPALGECDLTDLILRHWGQWTKGKQPPRCRDRFWWL